MRAEPADGSHQAEDVAGVSGGKQDGGVPVGGTSDGQGEWWDCFTRPTLLLQDAALAIGPEGGFTDAEVALAVAQGWQPVDLGPRILRVETAAVALAAEVIGLQ